MAGYCYMYSEFHVPDTYVVSTAVSLVLRISLNHCQGYCNSDAHVNTMLYNSYYQWVPVFFIVQAILFYIPRCIWLSTEGGMMAFLVTGCTGTTELSCELTVMESHRIYIQTGWWRTRQTNRARCSGTTVNTSTTSSTSTQPASSSVSSST